MRMPPKAWYKDWFSSPYYHKLYFERDDREAESFIRSLLSHLDPPAGARILDVACGRGRHSRILASMGYQVTGIDISAASIAEARQYETGNLEFFIHDMRLPFRVNYYDFAFNFFTSFGYFRTRREHDDSIRTISRSLKPKGVLVIDYLNVHFAEEHLVSEENRTIGDTLYTIRRWNDETHFYKKIIITDEAIGKPVEFTEKVAKFSLGDFTDMLGYQGLQVEEVFGDYRLGNYDVRKTPRLILVARRPG